MTVKSFTRLVGAAAAAAIMAVGMAGCLPHDCPLHTHVFGEWEVTLEPTCETEGTRVRFCSCGDEESETIEKKTGAECETVIQKTFIDERDGQVYRWVEINGHRWMAQNLNYAGNGNLGRCYNDDPANCETLGRLYTWDMVMNGAKSSASSPSGVQGICPAEWHVPSDAEWAALVNFAGGPSSAGSRLRAVDGWPESEGYIPGTDDYGFAALPGGNFHYFPSIGFSSLNRGSWWTSTQGTIVTGDAWHRTMIDTSSGVIRWDNNKGMMFSLRCKYGGPDMVWNIGAVEGGFNVIATLSPGSSTLTISGVGAMANFTISGDSIVPWYDMRSSITTVIIEDGVTSVGSSTFYNHTNITSVTIGNDVELIDVRAFSNTRLASVTIPNSVTTLRNSAFSNTSLTTVTIPASVTSIGTQVFLSSHNLTSIEVDENNAVYTSVDGVLFNKGLDTLITYPAGRRDTTYIIPHTVTVIGGSAFNSNRNLTSMNIPSGVRTIGDLSFSNTSYLTSVTIPSTVTSIRSYAFSGSGLTSVEIPNSMTSITAATFARNVNLASVIIPASVTTIGREVFEGCRNLTSITVLRLTPPSVENATTFAGVDKSTACLYVHESSIEAYREADIWGEFACIEAAPDYMF
ncbi:MAG: leucine-rich repeat protein [Chitinispirillales bacterium]|nr:leucine-rich repeat protein [Chitinispirillales bacterium]